MNITTRTRLGTVKILMLKGEKGDTGASGDYAELLHKPSINNYELDGNVTGANLGLASIMDVANVSGRVDDLSDDLQSVSQDVSDLSDDLNDGLALCMQKSAILVINGSATVNANSFTALIQHSLPTDKNYVVISASQTTGQNNTTYVSGRIDSAFPSAIFPMANVDNNTHKLNVRVNNTTSVQATIYYRIVLMEI